MNVIIKGAIPFSEARVLGAIVRLTEGFKHYRAVNLSYSDLAEATGMDAGAAKRAIKQLLDKRFISRTKRGKSKTSKTRYIVNYDSADWKIDSIDSIAIRIESYKGCEARTEDENDPRIDSSGDQIDPSTMDHFDPSTGDHFDPSTGDHFVPSYDEQTQASKGAAPEDRKYERKKKERSERKRHTTCVLEGRDLEYSFLESREEIKAANDLDLDEAIWQAAMYCKRRWREPVTQRHIERIIASFPRREEPVGNFKCALAAVHNGVDEVMRMNRAMKANGGSFVKDPIERSIREAGAELAMAYDQIRNSIAEGFPI